MAKGKVSHRMRLALEHLESRLNPTAILVPGDDQLVFDPLPDDFTTPVEFQPAEPGDVNPITPELPSGRNGFFDQFENGFFDAIRGDESEDGSSILRIGNLYKTLPSQEIVAQLSIPADQEVWLVSESCPQPVVDQPVVPESQFRTGVLAVAPVLDDGTDLPANPGDLIPDGEDPGFLDGLPPDLIGDPEFVLPNLGDIADTLPEDWNSIDTWLGKFQTDITVSLSTFSFAGADGVPAGDMILFAAPDKIWFDTRDGVSPDQDLIHQGPDGVEGLTNVQWLFTQAGTYSLTLTVTVTVTVGDQTETYIDTVPLEVLVGDVTEDPVLVGAVGGGGPAQVTIVDPATGEAKESFIAYENYLGGVVTSVSDVTGDGIPDYVTAPAGSGSPSHVTVRDGADQHVIASFYSFPGYRGRIVISSGDVDGDGYSDVAVGVAENGAPNVVLFSGYSIAQGTPSVIDSFYAFDPGYRGGIRMSMGDLDGNGLLDMAIGSGAGTTPNVTIWQLGGADGGFDLVSSYYAFDSAYRGGVSVTCTDVNGDGLDDVVTGSLEGAVPTVVVFDGHSDRVVKSFYPYMDYPADTQVIHRGINVSAVTDPETGKNSLVVSPLGGRASIFENAEEWRQYYESHQQGAGQEGPELTKEAPPAWWNGTGVLQIDFETQEIQKEWDLFPGFDGAVNVTGISNS